MEDGRTRAERLDGAEAVLDAWLAPDDTSCGFDDDYCGAPELAVVSSGCSVSGTPAQAGLWLFALGLALAWRCRRRGALLAALCVVSLCVVSLAATAAAQEAEVVHEDAPPIVVDDAEDPSDERVQEVAVEAQRGLDDTDAEIIAVHPEEREVTIREDRRVGSNDLAAPYNDGLGFAVRGIGGVDQVVFGAALGLRLQVATWLVLGLDVEWNGWHSMEGNLTQTGVANAMLSGIVVWTTFDRIELRSALHLGATMMLFDYPSAPAGTVGPLVGLTPLALAIRASREVRVVLEPGGLFISVPQVEAGVPLIHRHHRFAVGVEITP
jgi:MYXO-CTERM domain-containing protein